MHACRSGSTAGARKLITFAPSEGSDQHGHQKILCIWSDWAEVSADLSCQCAHLLCDIVVFVRMRLVKFSPR